MQFPLHASRRLAALFAVCLLASACNGSVTPEPQPDGTGNKSAVSPAESENESPTESASESETEAPLPWLDGILAPLTQPAEEWIVSLDGTTFGAAVRPSGKGRTEKAGKANIPHANCSIQYTSVFYGHESGINRDFVLYGIRFVPRRITETEEPLPAGCVLADIDANRFDDLVWWTDGTLYARLLGEGPALLAEADVSIPFAAPDGMTFAGCADMDGNGFADVLFRGASQVAVFYGNGAYFTGVLYDAPGLPDTGTLFCTDGNGDGVRDLLWFSPAGDGVLGLPFDGTRFGETFLLPFLQPLPTPASDPLPTGAALLLADMNTDGWADVVAVRALPAENKTEILTLYGHEGGFGDPSSAAYSATASVGVQVTGSLLAGDVSADGVPDLAGSVTWLRRNGYIALLQTGEGAYDYSIDLLKTDDGYRMYSGARWSDLTVRGDGDHVMLSTSADGAVWHRYLRAPMFYLGGELGQPDEWWSANTLEPEVLYVDGKWHMYWQCSYTTPSGCYGDKIGYAWSDDGVQWTRKTDEPVILCDDEEVGFNHEEAIYVPDDPDGKCWWLYTGHFVNNNFCGYVRLRSAVPDRFDWEEREETEGISQIGNQIGYCNLPGGGRLFLRITFTTAERNGVTQTVPVFNTSSDGIYWDMNEYISLAAVDAADSAAAANGNVYFLGMSTLNGTGEIEQLPDGSYHLLYGATTCASPVAPQIFSAECGVGEMWFTITEK